jgi:hypothetical protein
VVEGARTPPAALLEIGEDAIPPLGAQRFEALLEEALVIHADLRRRPLLGRREALVI